MYEENYNTVAKDIYDVIRPPLTCPCVCKDLSFCVFGLGNSLYEENYNTVAKDIDRCLHRLSARRSVKEQ